jgi:murine toxin
MCWNHAKIVASDGCRAIVGGHNLWWNAYGTYPPVHDISLHVEGPAAADAQAFVTCLWSDTTGIALRAWTFDVGYRCTELKLDSPRYRELIKPGLKGWPHKAEGARILTLPRAPHLGVDDSDVAKREVILNARRSLKICQQDLVFRHSFSKADAHVVCGWIAKALVTNRELRVQIVVSPRLAGGAKEPYSWGAGAAGTQRMISTFLAKLASNEALDEALGRLCVAAFAFTAHEDGEDFLVRSRTEGVDYFWSGTQSDTIYYEEGNVLPAGLSGKKSRPAPANHAKFYMADDTAAYVGSDNLYPHGLIEFGYLVEDAAVIGELNRTYWDQVWEYSKHSCVTPGHGRHDSATAVLHSPISIIENYF